MAKAGSIEVKISLDPKGPEALRRFTNYAQLRADATGPASESTDQAALFRDKWLLIRDLIGAKDCYDADDAPEYLAFVAEMVDAYRNREHRPTPGAGDGAELSR